MQVKPVKATWKQQQQITRLLLKRGRIIHQSAIPADLGIRAFKKTGASVSEVNKFKSDAWKKHQKASK